MNQIILWERMKNIIESCVTHEQLVTCKKMLYNTVDKKYFDEKSEILYSDLLDKISNKRFKLECIEDEKLLEKMNAKIESKKSTS